MKPEEQLQSEIAAAYEKAPWISLQKIGPVDTCDRCDGPGSVKTYANQAVLPINGRVCGIDWCIHTIVAALNAGGHQTVASCCGHGRGAGRISLADGRELTITRRDA